MARITVMVDNEPVRLSWEVATMVLALVDHQDTIHKLETGCVTLDYKRSQVTIGLSRLQYRILARRLLD